MTKKVEKEKSKEHSPIFMKRLGSVSATVFENQSEEKSYYNVQVTRRYKASDGTWHDSSVLNGESDVCLLLEVLTCTNRFLQERSMQSTEQE